MRITNSMVKTYQRCHRQYSYKYVQRLEPKAGSSLPLKRGSWLHELLEALYTTGDWRKRHKELTKEFNRLFDEEKDMYGDLPTICSNIMRSYEYHWREEDKNMEVIAAEQEVFVPMGKHELAFRFDLISEDEYGRWLWEHKSHKTIPGADYRFLDVQTARYVWGLNKIGTYGQITGVLWNYMRTKEPTVPHLNKDGRLSKAKLDTDLFTYVTALRNYGIDLRDHRDKILYLKEHNSFFRRERVPKPPNVAERLVKEAAVTANEITQGFVPVRSIQRDCEYYCQYKDLCVVELYGGDSDRVRKSKYVVKSKGEEYWDEEEPLQGV